MPWSNAPCRKQYPKQNQFVYYYLLNTLITQQQPDRDTAVDIVVSLGF